MGNTGTSGIGLLVGQLVRIWCLFIKGDRAGRVEAEARPSKLATGTRLQASKRPKPSEAEAGPSEAEPGRARPSQAELGRAGLVVKVGEYIIILSRGPTASCLLVISWVIASSNTQKSAFFIATTFTIMSTKFSCSNCAPSGAAAVAWLRGPEMCLQCICCTAAMFVGIIPELKYN